MKSHLEKINLVIIDNLQSPFILPIRNLRQLLVMRAWPMLIVVWKDDIDEKGRLYSFEFMQVVLIGPHAIYKFQTILLQHMNLLAI